MSSPAPSIGSLAYTWPEMFNEQPGLGHMKEITRTLVRDAAACSRLALLPPLRSCPHHFHGKSQPLNWNTYFDWSDYTISTPCLRTRRDLQSLIYNYDNVQIINGTAPTAIPIDAHTNLIIRHFPDPNIFNHSLPLNPLHVLERFNEPFFSSRFPIEVRTYADALAMETGPLSGVLHLRRGDLAGPLTTVENVSRYLQDKGVKQRDRFFVMTNETNAGYLSALRQHFPGIIYENESTVLSQVRETKSNDTYLIFRICKCLQENHDHLELGTLRFMQNHTPLPAATGVFNRIRRLNQRRHRVTLSWLTDNLPRTRVS